VWFKLQLINLAITTLVSSVVHPNSEASNPIFELPDYFLDNLAGLRIYPLVQNQIFQFLKNTANDLKKQIITVFVGKKTTLETSEDTILFENKKLHSKRVKIPCWLCL
jgi:hypothetical protein